ncbi:MAG: fimbrillin family protein [Bacteroidaceae bacterium]|nr:fimbrillin family protein [Bacteroidaceae bacterium]
MKKFLAFATLASVALVGCVNDEKMEMTSGAQKISFDNPVMSTQTRAYYGEIQGAEYPKETGAEESFKVFAKQHKGSLTDWENATDFWNGALEAKYDHVAGYWDTDQDYYWPNSDDNVWLSFGAYSPAVLTGTNANATYLNSGLEITRFEVEGTVSKQVDLMYSGPILNRKYSEATDVDGVDITFKHALSSIVFSAIAPDNNAKYTIHSIKVKGNFLTKGDFSEGLSGITDTGDKAVWSNTSATDNTEYSLATGLNLEVENTTTVITEKTSALLTIPHTEIELAAANPSVTIKYTVDPISGAADYEAEKTVALAEFKVAGGDPITKWERNKRYIYQFSFGGTSKIFFKPTVSAWDDGGVATVDIE